MSTLARAVRASSGLGVVGVVMAVIAIILFVIALPVFVVGAIVSLIFGIGFWTAALYVFLGRLALMMLGI